MPLLYVYFAIRISSGSILLLVCGQPVGISLQVQSMPMAQSSLDEAVDIIGGSLVALLKGGLPLAPAFEVQERAIHVTQPQPAVLLLEAAIQG
jgi:hypothetical protein